MARPVKEFRDFVGHHRVVKLLLRQLAGAKARGEPLLPILIQGRSGCGKTLLARAIAAEAGGDFVFVHARIRTRELAARLADVETGATVFLDEVHALEASAQELLMEAIDSMFPTGNGDSQSHKVPTMKRFALVLATDRPGELLDALKKRIRLPISLDLYRPREMGAIVDRIAASLKLLLTAQARNRVARVSHGLPRQTLMLLENLARHFPDPTRELSVQDIRVCLRDLGIDSLGLNAQHRKYLRFLTRVETASLDLLATHLGTDALAVQHDVEDLLQRLGFITIRHRGRELTALGKQWVDKHSATERGKHGPHQDRATTA
jgi:holliday junction DNA helicase RuvB